jgi:hypothetical protein
VGDWLIFPSMGAYTCSMSSTFNGFQPATVYYAMSPQLRCLGWGVEGWDSHQDLSQAREAGSRAWWSRV